MFKVLERGELELKDWLLSQLPKSSHDVCCEMEVAQIRSYIHTYTSLVSIILEMIADDRERMNVSYSRSFGNDGHKLAHPLFVFNATEAGWHVEHTTKYEKGKTYYNYIITKGSDEKTVKLESMFDIPSPSQKSDVMIRPKVDDVLDYYHLVVLFNTTRDDRIYFGEDSELTDCSSLVKEIGYTIDHGYLVKV